MNNEFTKKQGPNETRYILEFASGGGTSSASIASSPTNQDSILVQSRSGPKEVSKPRNFVAKHAQTSGAGAHKDRKKAAKQGDMKHKKSPMDMSEGYKVVPGIDRERYTERPGLEGPFSAKNGKVVYYDPKEGKYYDPNSDFYIDHDDWDAMNQDMEEGSRNAYLKHNNLVDLETPLAGLEDEFNKFLRTHDPEEKQKYQRDIKQRIKTRPMAGPDGVLPEQGVAEGFNDTDTVFLTPDTGPLAHLRYNTFKDASPEEHKKAIQHHSKHADRATPQKAAFHDMRAKMHHDWLSGKQGVAEGSKEKTQGIALSKAYKKDFDDNKPGQDRAETALTGTYSKTGKPGGELKKKGVADGWTKALNKAKRKQADIKLGKTEIKTNPNKYIPGKNPLKVGRDMRKNDTTGSKNAFHGMMGGPDLTSNLKIREQEMEDHEIQMASNELTSIAENAARLLDLVKKYSEMEGLEAWQQSKITKAADYLNSVLQSLNGEQSMAEGEEFNWNTADTSEPGQHAMQSKHNAGVKKWEDMLAKYTNDPEMTKHLQVLRINGLRPDFAEIKSQNWISGKEKLPKWYAKAAAYLPKLNTGLEEGDSDNFTIDDIKQLEQIADLDQMKSKAFELISRPSRRPMKPEKIEWFKNVLASKVSRLQVIKLMYDLFLSGEGLGALGTKNSMGKSSYRQRFSKEDAYMESLSAKLDLVSAKKSKN